MICKETIKLTITHKAFNKSRFIKRPYKSLFSFGMYFSY